MEAQKMSIHAQRPSLSTLLFIAALTLFSIKTTSAQTPVIITNQSLNIPGVLTVSTWQGNNNNKPYPGYPKMHYAFAGGDEISINFSTVNGKGTQRIIVTEYTSGSIAYSNNSFQTLNDIRIKIPKTGIYQFEFATNHVFDRQCNVILKRIPSDEASTNFNYNVMWKTVNDTVFITTEENVKVNTKYQAVSLQTPVNHYINSTTNLTGKNRVSFPVTLPPNTVEWYYTFAATRNPADVAKTKSNMQLLGDLSRAIDATGTLAFGMNMLSTPPGASYCDVFVIPDGSNTPFLDKLAYTYVIDASRENLMSGVVNIKNCCTSGRYFIGLRNNDMSYGIEVMIEVVAIVRQDTYETRNVKRIASVSQIKVPYLND